MDIDNFMYTVGTVAMAITAVLSFFTNRTARRSDKRGEETNRKIEEVRHETNSMKDALVNATALQNMAEGQAIGLAEGRSEAETRRLREDLDRQQLATPPSGIVPAVLIIPPAPPEPEPDK